MSSFCSLCSGLRMYSVAGLRAGPAIAPCRTAILPIRHERRSRASPERRWRGRGGARAGAARGSSPGRAPPTGPARAGRTAPPARGAAARSRRRRLGADEQPRPAARRRRRRAPARSSRGRPSCRATRTGVDEREIALRQGRRRRRRTGWRGSAVRSTGRPRAWAEAWFSPTERSVRPARGCD